MERSKACSQCPGCSHWGLSKELSEKKKADFLSSKLDRWQDCIQPIRGLEEKGRWNYRQKTTLKAEWRNTHWGLGLQKFNPETRRRIVIDIPDCPVHSEKLRAVLNFLSLQLPPPSDLPLSYIAIAGELVTLVVKRKALGAESLLDLLRCSKLTSPLQGLGVKGFFVNFNPSAGNRVFASRAWVKVWGTDDGTLVSELGTYFHGRDSFQQVLPGLHAHALETAFSFLNPKPGDLGLDLYSGIGVTLSLWRRAECAFLGIELGGSSIGALRKNLNLLETAELVSASDSYLRGRVEDRLPQMEQWIGNRTDPSRLLVFTNPPRTGMETAAVRWLTGYARPEKIAYLSCSAGTLGRDLSVLVQGGYRVQQILPYDFFPQTHHVETLALLDLDPSRSFFHPMDTRRDPRSY